LAAEAAEAVGALTGAAVEAAGIAQQDGEEIVEAMAVEADTETDAAEDFGMTQAAGTGNYFCLGVV
jgi:hypothetical protein